MAKRSISEKLRIPLSRFLAALLLLFIMFCYSLWEIYSPAVSSVLFFIGVILVALATFGRMWCSIYIAGYKNKSLITEGPYSMSRNPLYFFSLLGALGVGFATETLLIPLIIFSTFMLYYRYVIKSEEDKLTKLYGKTFEEYSNSTPRFFPKISHLTEPKKYAVNTVIIRRHILSTFWFVLSIGVLEIIEELHEVGILPVFFNIY